MVLKKRHIAKTVTYRIMSSLIGMTVSMIITNSWKISLSLSVAELLYKPLQYYIHERIWYRWIKFGIKDEQ